MFRIGASTAESLRNWKFLLAFHESAPAPGLRISLHHAIREVWRGVQRVFQKAGESSGQVGPHPKMGRYGQMLTGRQKVGRCCRAFGM